MTFKSLILSLLCLSLTEIATASDKPYWQFFKDNTDEIKNKLTYDKAFFSVSNEKNWGLALSGWISNDFFYDTRKMQSSREALLGIFPLKPLPDADGKDLNARASFRLLALNTRVRLKITTPDVLKAKVTGLVEGWFAGISENDINGFALRHAYINFSWKNEKPFQSDLLIGQFWVPFFDEMTLPKVVNPNAGLPFNPFARQPQIRYTQQLKTFQIVTYLNSQLDFASTGPLGKSTTYMSYSLIPEMGIILKQQLTFNREDVPKQKLNYGIGFDYKNIVPRTVTASNRITKERVASYSAMAYLDFQHFFYKDAQKSGQFRWTLKTVYGQNLNDMVMLGGYAIKAPSDGVLEDDYQYTCLQNINLWTDISLNIKRFEVGVFGGWIKNLGSLSPVYNPEMLTSYYGSGVDIDALWRCSARLKYEPANFVQFGFETEYTQANYADKLNAYGLKTASVDKGCNLRFLLNTTLF